jgi:hypothetical protein
MGAYRQAVPAIQLSLERLTAAVPDDGYYYVLKDGKVEGRFRSLKRAQARYKELLAASDYEPPPVERKKADPSKEAVERYMDELEDHWADSHKYTRRGGKTMYRS